MNTIATTNATLTMMTAIFTELLLGIYEARPKINKQNTTRKNNSQLPNELCQKRNLERLQSEQSALELLLGAGQKLSTKSNFSSSFLPPIWRKMQHQETLQTRHERRNKNTQQQQQQTLTVVIVLQIRSLFFREKSEFFKIFFACHTCIKWRKYCRPGNPS
jgi:hypothetical protein